ncbi:MAG: DUF4423 domain-containing protein [Bdellovibrionota bacterium]
MDLQALKEHIEQDFLQRKSRNANYSLRSHARYLEVDPGALSKFFRGEKVFSSKKLLGISKRINISSPKIKSLFKDKEFEILEAERFEFVAQWYYFAILECFQLKDFQSSPKWVANKLGLSVPVVQLAINQLLRLGIIELDENGQWVQRIDQLSTLPHENVDDLSLRKLQEQLLGLANQSIHYAPSETKSHSSLTVAVDPKLIPQIKEEIKNFRRKLNHWIEDNSTHKKDVYCLQINWFECLENRRKK